jgi:hypothetical protein
VRGGHGDRAGWAWVGAEVEVAHGRIGILRSPEGSGIGVRGFTGCDFTRGQLTALCFDGAKEA